MGKVFKVIGKIILLLLIIIIHDENVYDESSLIIKGLDRRKRYPNIRDKACFSNIRLITGALEMYNMDSEIPMKTLDIDKLVAEHLLKAKPSMPEPDCKYKGFNLTEGGEIFCVRHGYANEEAMAKLAREEKARERKIQIIKILKLVGLVTVLYFI